MGFEQVERIRKIENEKDEVMLYKYVVKITRVKTTRGLICTYFYLLNNVILQKF